MFRILWSIVCNAFHRHLKPNIVYITCGRPSNADLQQWYNDQPMYQQQLEDYAGQSDHHRQLIELLQAWLPRELRFDTERTLYGGCSEVRQWEREDGPAALQCIEEIAESPEQLALAYRMVHLASVELLLSQHVRVVRTEPITECYRLWSNGKNAGWPFRNTPIPT